MAKKNYDELAKTIIEHVGGKENIESVTHCATRLRFTLHDVEKADTEVLSKTPGVAKVLNAMGQYQIVIGNEVADVYNAVTAQVGEIQAAPAESEEKKKNGPMAIFMDFMGSIMRPIMGPFTASGILKGLLALATLMGVSGENGIYILFSAIADGIFYFLPIFLSWSVGKKLGASPALSLLIGAILCYPSLNGTDIALMGHTFNLTYTSTFLPAILVMLFAAPIEKWLNKHLPGVIRSFVAPLLTMVIAIPLGYCIVGPFANLIANAIAAFVNWLYTFGALPVGILTGIFWQVLVVFGIHQVLMTACYVNLFNGTGDLILAISIIIAFSQSATVLAMVLRSKNKAFREMALPTVVSGIFGITEPALYGVTLPRIKYFIISCIGGTAAGIVCALFGVRKYSFGSGFLAIPTLVNPANPQIFPIVLAIVLAVGISFVLSFVLFDENDI